MYFLNLKQFRKKCNESSKIPTKFLKPRPSLFDPLFDRDTKLVNDANQLLNIFPDVVWRTLSQRMVDDFETAESFANASLYFRKLTWRQRTVSLFPKVWEILWNAPENRKEIPNRQLLQRNDALRLRLVCHDWCNAIDQQRDNNPTYYRMTQDPEPALLQERELDWHRYEEQRMHTNIMFSTDNTDFLSEFQKHFEETHESFENDRNPFPGRHLTINHCESDAKFLSSLRSALTRYGHNLWYCTLIGSAAALDAVRYYLDIKGILELLPNLKVLRCRNVGDYQENNGELATIINAAPLPHLSNLKFLVVDKISGQIFHEILEQSKNLKMVEMKCQPIEDVKSLEILGLEKLSLKLQNLNEFLTLRELQCGWQLLDTLYLEILECPYSKWQSLFNLLESKWAKSLQNLSLSLWNENDMETEEEIALKCSAFRLNLPFVKRFKIAMTCSHSLDFILPMKSSLEFLQVDVMWNLRDYRQRALSLVVEQQEIVQFLGYFENTRKNNKELTESNIWKLFPKLRRIDIWDWHAPRYEVIPRCYFELHSSTNFYCGSTRPVDV